MKKKGNKAKRNAYFIGIFIVIIMVGSILGLYAPGTESDKVEYNSHSFYRTQNGWFTRLGNDQLPFIYLPQVLENISLGSSINTQAEKIYFITDNNPEINTKYIIDRLRGIFYYFTEVRVVEACLSEDNCPETYPIITCEDAAAQVLYLKKGNVTGGYLGNNCITLEINSNEDIEMVAERLIYHILRIMD